MMSTVEIHRNEERLLGTEPTTMSSHLTSMSLITIITFTGVGWEGFIPRH